MYIFKLRAEDLFLGPQAPVCVGTTKDVEWKEVVRKEIVRRIEQ